MIKTRNKKYETNSNDQAELGFIELSAMTKVQGQ